MKRRKRAVIILLILAALAAVLAVTWRKVSYDTVSLPDADPSVTVTEKDRVTFFDGPGTGDALIFYPGAMVEHTAYSALLQQIAAKGVDCFLVRMPLRIAFLGKGTAEELIGTYDYEHWYLGGHSLGGVVACMEAAEHPEKLTGLVLLASYSSVDLSGTSLKVISLTGSEDGVIRRDKQENSRALLPADARYVTIEGGNHAQFGTYGAQKGDGTATITGEEQRDIACRETVDFIKGN